MHAHTLRTANIRIKILDVRGFDSSVFLKLRGEIIMSIGNLPDLLSQQILAGKILVGRLGVAIGVSELRPVLLLPLLQGHLCLLVL